MVEVNQQNAGGKAVKSHRLSPERPLILWHRAAHHSNHIESGCCLPQIYSIEEQPEDKQKQRVRFCFASLLQSIVLMLSQLTLPEPKTDYPIPRSHDEQPEATHQKGRSNHMLIKDVCCDNERPMALIIGSDTTISSS